MTTLIEQIKLKADSIPTNTKENRRVKGAYVDCLMMAKEANKNFIKSGVNGSLSLPEDKYRMIRLNLLSMRDRLRMNRTNEVDMLLVALLQSIENWRQ